MTTPASLLAVGRLVPEGLLHSELFAVLAAFVAINTVMYGALAVAKMLPKVYPTDWVTSRNRRVASRSIYLDPSVEPQEADPRRSLAA